MGENSVLESMRTVQFHVSGSDRTYLDFYTGFGYSISIYQFMIAALLWQLATQAKTGSATMRPMIAAIGVATAMCGVVACFFILPVAAVFSAALLVSLVMAYVAAGRPTSGNTP